MVTANDIDSGLGRNTAHSILTFPIKGRNRTEPKLTRRGAQIWWR